MSRILSRRETCAPRWADTPSTGQTLPQPRHTAIAADGTHPTRMHSCFVIILGRNNGSTLFVCNPSIERSLSLRVRVKRWNKLATWSYHISTKVFFLIFGRHVSSDGATDTPVLDFWWRFLWVSKTQWAALFTLGRDICDVHSLVHLRYNTCWPLGGHCHPHTCKQALVALDTRTCDATAWQRETR